MRYCGGREDALASMACSFTTPLRTTATTTDERNRKRERACQVYLAPIYTQGALPAHQSVPQGDTAPHCGGVSRAPATLASLVGMYHIFISGFTFTVPQVKDEPVDTHWAGMFDLA